MTAYEYRAHIVWANGIHTFRDARDEAEAEALLSEERDVIKRGEEPAQLARVERREVHQWEPA